MTDVESTIRSVFEEFEEKDDRVHEGLRKGISDVKTDLYVIQSDLKSFVLAGRILWAIGFLFVSSLGAVVGFLLSEIGDLEDRVDLLSAKQHAFEERGTKWGEDLDDDVQRIDQEMRDLREKYGDN